MAYSATINIGGGDINVLKVYHSVEQGIDAKGKPSTDVKSGKITIIIDGALAGPFTEWLSDPFAVKDGTITYYKVDEDSKFRELKFLGGMTRSYIEYLSPDISTMNDKDTGINPFTFQMDLAYSDKLGIVYDAIHEYQNRSNIAYLAGLTFHADSITMNGVDHDNKWAKS